MSDDGIINLSENDEIELLLPWYVTGKISADDKERVETYLAANPHAAEQLTLIQEDLDATTATNEALGTVRAGALDNLLSQIEKQDGMAIARARQSGILQRIASLFPSFDRPAMRLVGAALSVLVILQGISIGVLISSGEPDIGFETATGPAQTDIDGTRLLISFSETATANEVSELLLDVGASIVDGPRGAGIFEIQISNEIMDDEEIQLVITELREHKNIIAFVARTR